MKSLSIPGILLLASVSTQAGAPMIVAHRGASKDAPENTIPAFELAWAQGADAIEGDFRLTKDGHIVCIHDKDTKKVAGRKLVVAKSSLDELQQLDVGGNHGSAFKGTAIPTLEDVLETIPGNKTIYIEIKCGKSIVPKLLHVLAESKIEPSQVVVISFDEDVIKALKAKAPELKAFWLCSFEKKRSGKVAPSLKKTLKTLGEIKADGFSAGKDHISQAFIAAVMEHGYEFHVWTVDDLECAKDFREWGAKSITTNRPGKMKTALAE
jgi:glycerophosphoryl diester phosphodiesterase